MKLLWRGRLPIGLASLCKLVSSFAVLLTFTFGAVIDMHSSYTLLSLGDSYTIGEMVSPAESFPRQTVQLLRESGHDFRDPEIIARTGWTTGELQHAISQYQFSGVFDFVTLLIGVNNQYRGRSIEEYRAQFESVLKQAIALANERPDHVIVLSIPDWSVTPFAKNCGRDRAQIAREIDALNEINGGLARWHGVQYIAITADTRQALHDLSLVAQDGLHPSATEYAKWADKVAAFIKSRLN